MAEYKSPVSSEALEAAVNESEKMTFEFDPDVELQPTRPTMRWAVNRRFLEVFRDADEDYDEKELGPLARDSIPFEAEAQYGQALRKKFPNPDDVIIKRILCSWCDKIAQPPIYMCQSGHLICEKCMGFVPNCPYLREKACRRPFVSGKHLFYEYMYNRMTMPCKNSQKGCVEVLTGQDKKKHEDTKCGYDD